jgi:NAD+--dinitrogen-reductase ADP-D-ribosyltransferase
LSINKLGAFTTSRERTDEFGDYLLSARAAIQSVCYTRMMLGMMLQGEVEYTVIGGLYEVSITAW